MDCRWRTGEKPFKWIACIQLSDQKINHRIANERRRRSQSIVMRKIWVRWMSYWRVSDLGERWREQRRMVCDNLCVGVDTCLVSFPTSISLSKLLRFPRGTYYPWIPFRRLSYGRYGSLEKVFPRICWFSDDFTLRSLAYPNSIFGGWHVLNSFTFALLNHANFLFLDTLTPENTGSKIFI